ncbi:hypothetical protein HYC85_020827 [Camellia sinensis]|uniref:Uncharacterized protein n=1 Tax=Camellia sinensis TaxID=4442 RepID=A0A7J7GSN7_CAMSI|nr:hypothetical protein HYC85_020827 [Camellia sinensis]
MVDGGRVYVSTRPPKFKFWHGRRVGRSMTNGSPPRVPIYGNVSTEATDKFSTDKDGKVSQLEHVFIRGSKVRHAKNAPMFKRLESRIKGKGSAIGVGWGRAVAMRARAISEHLAQAAGRGAPPGRGAVPSIRR